MVGKIGGRLVTKEGGIGLKIGIGRRWEVGHKRWYWWEVGLKRWETGGWSPKQVVDGRLRPLPPLPQYPVITVFITKTNSDN